MSTRPGLVAEAATEVLADRLSTELPGLEQDEIRRIARAQVAELTRAGFHVTVPVPGLAAAQRRMKANRTAT